MFFLSSEAVSSIYKYFFKFRYLILYILIGLVSILFELQLRNIFISIPLNEFYSSIISLFLGIILAFFLNIKINFKLSPGKVQKSFIYFFLISSISFLTQKVLSKFIFNNFDYEITRIVISGICFIFFYFIHIKISFKDIKQVGVAIYANGVEDIAKIYNKIQSYPDFIQVDIVDKSFYPNAPNVQSYRLETIKAYWPNKKIHIHIMSKEPKKWIQETLPYADKIFFHYEMKNKVKEILDDFNNDLEKFGLAVSVNTEFQEYEKYIKLFKNFLVVSIPQPGFSGQKFSDKTYKIVQKIKNYQGSTVKKLCVDGGINENTIKNLDADEIVSGSYVLEANNPIQNILKLQFNL
jgi:ribulose-phosphate 3-epimerase